MMATVLAALERTFKLRKGVPSDAQIEAMRHKFRAEAAALQRTSKIIARSKLLDEMIGHQKDRP